MKYSYTAYFAPDEEDHICHVTIPALDIEYDITPARWTKRVIETEAARELGMTLYLWEQEGIERPADITECDSDGEGWVSVLKADTVKLSERTRIVERIDF